MRKIFHTIYFFSLLVVLSSCSTMSKNMTSHGHYVLKSGVFGNDSWDEGLEFKRTTWYSELSMVFDVLYFETDPQSNFYKWFSEDEKKMISACSKSIIYLIYNQSADKISLGEFYVQLESNGASPFFVPGFKKHLKLHPDYNKESLKFYTLKAYCWPKESKDSIKIDFPGFHPQSLY